MTDTEKEYDLKLIEVLYFGFGVATLMSLIELVVSYITTSSDIKSLSIKFGLTLTLLIMYGVWYNYLRKKKS